VQRSCRGCGLRRGPWGHRHRGGEKCRRHRRSLFSSKAPAMSFFSAMSAEDPRKSSAPFPGRSGHAARPWGGGASGRHRRTFGSPPRDLQHLHLERFNSGRAGSASSPVRTPGRIVRHFIAPPGGCGRRRGADRDFFLSSSRFTFVGARSGAAEPVGAFVDREARALNARWSPLAAASRRSAKAVALLWPARPCTRGASAAASALYFSSCRGVREVLACHLAWPARKASTP